MLAALGARVAALEQRRDRSARALDRLGRALGSTHDRGAIVNAVLETSALIFRPEAAVFFARSGSRLIARAFDGRAGPGLELAVGEGLAGCAAGTGVVAVWPGPVALAAAEPLADEATTAVAVPVGSGSRTFGAIALYGREGAEPYSTADVEALRGLVSQAATAIENAELYEEAARLSITDGLTGLWNRRGFELRAASEMQRARRFGESFGVVMIDVDRFKLVNDVHGHQAGDAVLVELAHRLTEATRDVDVVARLGGEEFVLLLPSTTLEGTATLAGKLRDRVSARSFPIDAGDVLVTISLGVATYPDHGGSIKDLLAAADAALYRAKDSGRDRIEAATVAGRDSRDRT